MKRITVLLAAYNGEKYIAEQLDSILEQSVPEIQVLVSDDGSTDGTREILLEYQERYPDRIRRCDRRSDGASAAAARAEGLPVMPAPARNFFWLLSQAEGDYLLFSDQDDVWKQDKTEKLLARMQELEESPRVSGCDGQPGSPAARKSGSAGQPGSPAVGKAGSAGQPGSPAAEKLPPALVFSDMEVTDRELRSVAPSFFAYSRCNPDRLSLAELLVENPATGGAMMINRSLADLVGGGPRVCYMHDWWIALCAVCFGRIDCVHEALSLYRQHEGNVLGATRTGSLEDLSRRAARQSEVEANYRLMFAQAGELLRMYGDRLAPEKRAVLEAYLRLPSQSPAQRFMSIWRNHFCKSSRLQTLAQCVTMPGPGDTGEA